MQDNHVKVRSSVSGIFKVYGDPRPLMSKIYDIAQRLRSGDTANGIEIEYKQLLCAVAQIIDRPLGEKYEVEKFIPDEYREYLEAWSKGRMTFFKLLEMPQVKHIALVKVLKPRSQYTEVMKFETIRNYYGNFKEKDKIIIQTVPGYRHEFAKKNDTSLIVGSSDSIIGVIGYMPMSDVEGRVVLESFAWHIDYWDGFVAFPGVDRHYVLWADLERYLLNKYDPHECIR